MLGIQMARRMKHLYRYVISPVILLVLICGLASAEYYRIPTQNKTCFNDEVPCITLSELAAGQNDYLSSNTSSLSLILEPGNHTLGVDFLISNITKFSMYGNTDTAQNPIMITCFPEAKFVLIGIDYVEMSGISFVNCFNNTVLMVNQFSFENGSIQNHVGFCTAALQLNLVNHVSIQLSLFSIKVVEPFSICVSESEMNTSMTIIGFHDCSNVSMTTIFFEDIKSRDSKLVYISNSTVTIDDSSFVNNIANSGTMFYVVDSILSVHWCTFMNNTYLSEIASFVPSVPGATIVAASSTIEIESTEFLYELTEIDTLTVQNSTLVLNDCTFVSNVARSLQMSTIVSWKASVLINNCSFTGNIAGRAGVLIAIQSSVTIVQCVFYKNSAKLNADSSALLSKSSALVVKNSQLTITRSFFLYECGC